MKNIQSVVETPYAREITLPLNPTGRNSSETVSFRSWCDEEGRYTLIVEACADFDNPRPAAWQPFKERLRQRGFEMDTDEGAEDDELFFPTSFFSADAVLHGQKIYRNDQFDMATRDMISLLHCLGRDGSPQEKQAVRPDFRHYRS